MSLLLPAATPGWGMVTPLSAHFPNCRADQMPSALPHSAAKGPYAAVSPAISPVAARPAYPHCRRQRCSAGRWRRPYLRIPQLPGRPDTICSPLQRGRDPYAAVSPAISSAAARPTIPTAADSDTRLGDGDAPYPRIPPTAGPTIRYLFSPTARQGSIRRGIARYIIYGGPPRLSPLPPTATPPIRAFPQRHPARATPCKPKGSVLPPCTGPCGRTRQAKGVSICTLGARSGVPPTKAALPLKKRRVSFPRQSVSQRRDIYRERRRGALQCPVPPSGGPCKTRSPFPP